MKTNLVFLKFIVLLLFILVFSDAKVFAVPFDWGKNITVSDGRYRSSNGWYGAQEDNEVEPGMAASQVWDLEAFYLNRNVLSVVGGFDFKNGVAGYSDLLSGDIFFDVDGDASGGSVTGVTKTGFFDVQETFGYDYVIKLDFNNYGYSVFDITGGATLKTVKYRVNDSSNAWRYVEGGKKIGQGTFTYMDGLSGSDVGGLKGDNGNDIHYAITGFDISFLNGEEFIAHFTMGCGNDNLIGKGSAPVPEPATIILMGTGLIGMGGLFRKKQLKFHKNKT